MIADVLRPEWVDQRPRPHVHRAVLAVGVACALDDVYVPAFARLFLRKSRAAVEVAQYANDQFLERELFATPERNALLVVVSMLEHRVVILPDKGLRAHVTTAQWDGVIARMTERLAAGATGEALLAGLDAAEALLRGQGPRARAANLFSDRPVVDGQP